jgi:hypothetical protein
MPLTNSTFISFRHGREDLSRKFIEQFYDGLSGEIEAQLGQGAGRVFLDQERLHGGDFFNPLIARELCTSATMIMIYTPSYFDLNRTYCAREYKAMVALEAARMAKLPQEQRNHGLIVPVIFRGDRYLPNEIKDQRQFYDFQQFLLSHRTLSKHPKYAPVLREIADYIAERYRVLSALDPAELNCDGFSLPEEGVITPWLQGVVPIAPPLPGRTP